VISKIIHNAVKYCFIRKAFTCKL